MDSIRDEEDQGLRFVLALNRLTQEEKDNV
jgi:hypothetical protein